MNLIRKREIKRKCEGYPKYLHQISSKQSPYNWCQCKKDSGDGQTKRIVSSSRVSVCIQQLSLRKKCALNYNSIFSNANGSGNGLFTCRVSSGC